MPNRLWILFCFVISLLYTSNLNGCKTANFRHMCFPITADLSKALQLSGGKGKVAANAYCQRGALYRKVRKLYSTWIGPLPWLTVRTRENWVIYRGPGFFTVVWFGSSLTPSPSRQNARPCSERHTGRLINRENLLSGEGGGQGAKSDDGEKGWSSFFETEKSRLRKIDLLCIYLWPLYGLAGWGWGGCPGGF